MKTPVTQPEADDIYECVLDAHQGLDEAQSELLNARLILLLAHHVGNVQTVRDLVAAARKTPELPDAA